MTNRPTAVPRLSWSDVRGRRLDRHGLSTPVRDGKPADAVAAMCGAHAQVLSAAELSIGLRVAGATRVDVGDALWRERSLVKTFGPRGTVHLLPTRELPLWAGALSAIPPSSNIMPADLRLTPDQTGEVVDLDQEVTMTPRRIEHIIRKTRHRDKPLRGKPGKTKPAVEQRRPDGDGHLGIADCRTHTTEHPLHSDHVADRQIKRRNNRRRRRARDHTRLPGSPPQVRTHGNLLLTTARQSCRSDATEHDHRRTDQDHPAPNTRRILATLVHHG
jgi:hypothetical protein